MNNKIICKGIIAPKVLAKDLNIDRVSVKLFQNFSKTTSEDSHAGSL
jgi:hypothetical protein